MKYTGRPIALALAFAGAFCASADSLIAVPLENWRQPLLDKAVLLSGGAVSQSGMFWDQIQPLPVLERAIWPGKYGKERLTWHVEPAITGLANTRGFSDNKTGAVHLDVFNRVAYKWITVVQTLDVDSRYLNSPYYVWHNERFAAGRIEDAYFQASWDWGFCRFGRMKRNWGPFSDRSLLLSSNSHTYDALEIQTAIGSLEFRHLFAAFPYANSWFDIDGSGGRNNRYLTAHSLNMGVGDWAVFGFAEAVLFTRSEGIPDFQYINPFSVYTVTNTNKEGRGNLLLEGHWRLKLLQERLAFEGQVVLDDIQVDDDSPGDQEPTHWGIDTRAIWRHAGFGGKDAALAVDYHYLSRWLYTVPPSAATRGERYTYLGQGLGAETNDGDRIRLSYALSGERYWLAGFSVDYTRKGNNDLKSEWPDNNQLGYRREIPLSQRDGVKETLACELEGQGYFRDFINAGLRLRGEWARNGAPYAFEPVFSGYLSLHYSNAVFRGRSRDN